MQESAQVTDTCGSLETESLALMALTWRVGGVGGWGGWVMSSGQGKTTAKAASLFPKGPVVELRTIESEPTQQMWLQLCSQ